MTGFLVVKNWRQFQHYQDRNPPWIKLHRALLDDYEFARLHDASKLHLILIWLYASQNNGRIPEDAAFLQKKLGLGEPPDLETLKNEGFLFMEQSASNQQAERKQDASPRALAREEESREEKRQRREENTQRDHLRSRSYDVVMKDYADIKQRTDKERSDYIFGAGLDLLMTQGAAKESGRAALGQLLAKFGSEYACCAVWQALQDGAGNARAYMVGVAKRLKEEGGKHGGFDERDYQRDATPEGQIDWVRNRNP